MRETRSKLALITVRAAVVAGCGAWLLAGRLQGLTLALAVLLLRVRYLDGLVIVVVLLVGNGAARLSSTRRRLKAHILALMTRLLLTAGRTERG